MLFTVWLALGYPTCVWWKSSVLWVAIMSLYTILWQHANGWSVERARKEVTDAVS